MEKVELLAPAGDLEKLKYAIIYGADAVYIGGQIFGLRAATKNFSVEDMEEGLKFAHERGKKVYLVLNIIPHNEDINILGKYLEDIKHLPFDAFILSDPGTLLKVREILGDVEIHLSTQANNTNYMSAMFWKSAGVDRIVLARELSFKEIGELVAKTHEYDIEYEAFIHGAMCISYSGRCLLSNYMTGRDANKGDCAQSCRWKYHLVEEKRPGEYYPVIEDENGTYFFNSKDLCMIEHIDDVIRSGIKSLKIEGRNKSIYYVANIVRAYREAIDAFYRDPEGFEFNADWLSEIKKASHRDFTTGFYFDKPDGDAQLYGTTSYIREYDFLGVVLDYDNETKMALIEQRNKFSVGDEIEIMGPGYHLDRFTVKEMYNDKTGQQIESAPHARMLVRIKMENPVEKHFMIRKERTLDE